MKKVSSHIPVLSTGLTIIALVIGVIAIGPTVDASARTNARKASNPAATGVPTNDDYQFRNVVQFGTSGPASCLGDLDNSGDVGFDDLVTLLASWGACGGCPADLDTDGDVDFDDLVTLLAAWGPCP